MRIKLLLGMVLCSLPAFSQCASATRFWVGGGSSTAFNATGNTNWATSSGGSNNASVPTTGTVWCADANSGSGTINITANTSSLGAGDTTNFTGTLQWGSGIFLEMEGNLIIGASVTISIGSTASKIEWNGSAGTYTLTELGTQTLPLIEVNSSGTTLELGSAITTQQLDCLAGTFNSENYAITVNSTPGVLSSGSSACTATLGSSTVT